MKRRLSATARMQANQLDALFGFSLQDPFSGMDPNYWAEFFRGFYIEAPKARLRIVLDWDRTVTMTEGFARPKADGFFGLKKDLGLPTLTLQDVLEQHCGSLRRVFDWQNFFNLLQSHQAVIVILTNNGSCMDRPELMRDMIHFLTQNRPFELMCSRSFASKKIALEHYTKPLSCE